MKKNKVSNFLLFENRHELAHQLNSAFEDIKKFTVLKTFIKSPLFEKIGDEIHRVENGIE